MDANFWTVAYRKPRGSHFHRIDLSLNWYQAFDLAGRVGEALPGYEVYYTSNALYDATNRTGDSFRIMVHFDYNPNKCRWIPIDEFGTLPDGVSLDGLTDSAEGHAADTEAHNAAVGTCY